MRDRITFAGVSAGWLNAELFAIRPAHRRRFFVSSGNLDRVNVIINQLLLIVSPLVFAYWSGLAQDNGYSWLISTIAHSEFVVCTLLTFLYVASKCLTSI